LTIHGEDGENYDFLLKGHEDLRQDERVMQVRLSYYCLGSHIDDWNSSHHLTLHGFWLWNLLTIASSPRFEVVMNTLVDLCSYLD